MDLCVDAFSANDLIGSTFFAGTFEHYTSRPIWVRKMDGLIRLSVPPGSMNYVLAWGDYVERRRERQRQQSCVGAGEKIVQL